MNLSHLGERLCPSYSDRRFRTRPDTENETRAAAQVFAMLAAK